MRGIHLSTLHRHSGFALTSFPLLLNFSCGEFLQHSMQSRMKWCCIPRSPDLGFGNVLLQDGRLINIDIVLTVLSYNIPIGKLTRAKGLKGNGLCPILYVELRLCFLMGRWRIPQASLSNVLLREFLRFHTRNKTRNLGIQKCGEQTFRSTSTWNYYSGSNTSVVLVPGFLPRKPTYLFPGSCRLESWS